MGYTDISRALQLKKDYDNYQKWLDLSTEARQTAFEAVNTPANRVKTERVAGFVAPFNVNGTALIYLPSRIISSNQTGRGATLATTVRGLLSNYVKATLATADEAVTGVKNFKPAKMTLTQRVTTATTKSASRITKRKYFRHENDAVTGNLGKQVVGDDFDSVVANIRSQGAFTGFLAENTANKFRFVPESI